MERLIINDTYSLRTDVYKRLLYLGLILFLNLKGLVNAGSFLK